MKSRFILPVLMLPMLLLMTSGCARFIKPVKTISPAAADLLARIRTTNGDLKACKGIGTISSWLKAGTMPRTRFAWLCRLPDRLRLEILAPTGTPVMTLSADGKYVYFLPRDGKHRLRRKKADDINLEKIISFPLRLTDAGHLLAGAVPLHEFDSAERVDLPDDNYMLQLTNHWPDRIEKIYFEETTGRPVRIEFLQGSQDQPRYSATFSGVRKIDGKTIPESIILEDDRGNKVVITIDRYWLETDIPVEKFILTDPA